MRYRVDLARTERKKVESITELIDDSCQLSVYGEVHVHREARKAMPNVWSYYFHLAAIAAKDLRDRTK